MRKYLLLSGALLLGLGVFASAQGINTVPTVGLITSVLKQNTYSATSIGLAPASSATDIFCISASTTKTVSIRSITISGTAGTLVTAPYTLLRRVSLDTGGTAATTTALPVAAPHLSTEPAGTAVLTAYTANPTIVDSSPIYYRTQTLTTPVTSAGTSSSVILWTFGEATSGWFNRGVDLAPNTTQQACINLNAVSISSGLLNISIEWIES